MDANRGLILGEGKWEDRKEGTYEYREKSTRRKLTVKIEGQKVKKREYTTFLVITAVLMQIQVFFKATKYSRKTCSTDKPSPFNRRVPGLTLRRLMSYIYMEHPFLMFLDHTQRRSTVGRTPLDE